MIWAIISVLVVLWLIGFLAMHVASPLIHLLLVIALIVFIVDFVRGRGTPVV